MNSTNPPNVQSSPDITLLLITAGTLAASLLDVIINGYVGYQKRHFHSQCCNSCWKLDFDSDSEKPATGPAEDPL